MKKNIKKENTGQTERSYSKTENKMLPLIEKVKKGEGIEAAQMKIKALQDKRRAEKMKAERIDNRAERKSNRAANKTISRISKVNNKPKK